MSKKRRMIWQGILIQGIFGKAFLQIEPERFAFPFFSVFISGKISVGIYFMQHQFLVITMFFLLYINKMRIHATFMRLHEKTQVI